MNRIAFSIPLPPRGQARARHMVTKSGIGITYKAKEQKAAENKIEAYIVQAANGRRLSGPIRLQLVARVQIPASWSKKKREDAINCNIFPEVKPDLSNIIKNLEDVCNGLLFDDDKAICQIISSKVYSEHPGYDVSFSTIVPDEIEDTAF